MKPLTLSLIISSLLLYSAMAALAALPKDGLVLHYTFDNSAIKADTVTDQSGGGNDGTLNGGVKIGNGFATFDGADGYVVSPALEVRVADQSFTALGWFRTDEAENGPLWMWGDNSNPSSSGDAEAPVGWRASSGNFAAGFYTNGHQYAEAGETYADGAWHFVAQVGDEDTGYLYIDGEQIANASAGYVYSGSPYFIIGARTKNSGSDIDDVEYFQGEIQQIAIYDSALTEAQLREIDATARPVSQLGKLATTWGQIKN